MFIARNLAKRCRTLQRLPIRRANARQDFQKQRVSTCMRISSAVIGQRPSRNGVQKLLRVPDRSQYLGRRRVAAKYAAAPIAPSYTGSNPQRDPSALG